MKKTLIYLMLISMFSFSGSLFAQGEEGDLIYLSVEKVDMDHMGDYQQWGVEHKAAAEKDGFDTFWVSSGNDGTFTYAYRVGKTMADFDAFQKRWNEWVGKDHMKAMYDKYKKSITSTEQKLWRHNPAQSYNPEGYTSPSEPEYIRGFIMYIKFGHEEEASKLITEIKELSEEHGVSTPFNVFWNIFGEEGPCFAVRTVYKDVEEWAEKNNEMDEKIGAEKMQNIRERFSTHMRSWEETEVFPVHAFSNVPQE